MRKLFSGLLLLAAGALWPARLQAHCDGLDGPVVKAAQAALDGRDITGVLIWVQPADEPEMRRVFQQTLAVRTLSPAARALADRFFFETVVRLHRAGEGAPYSGLKPAGRDLGPAIPAADQALDRRSSEPVATLLTEAMRHHLRERFDAVMAARSFDPGDVAAGRRFVKAYVEFVHYVERLFEAATTAAHGHAADATPPTHVDHDGQG